MSSNCDGECLLKRVEFLVAKLNFTRAWMDTHDDDNCNGTTMVFNSRVGTKMVSDGRIDTKMICNGRIDANVVCDDRVGTKMVFDGRIDTKMVYNGRIETNMVCDGRIGIRNGQVKWNNADGSRNENQNEEFW